MQARQMDVWSGVFWIIFGGAIVACSASMPIPRHLGATILTGPGLVPSLLGGALMILGAVLSIRALRNRTVDWEDANTDPETVSNGRALAALVMMVGYAALLATRQPFLPATIAFVTAFVVAFNWEGRDGKSRAKVIAGALTLAVCTAVAVQFVFETLFFVRLP